MYPKWERTEDTRLPADFKASTPREAPVEMEEGRGAAACVAMVGGAGGGSSAIVGRKLEAGSRCCCSACCGPSRRGGVRGSVCTEKTPPSSCCCERFKSSAGTKLPCDEAVTRDEASSVGAASTAKGSSMLLHLLVRYTIGPLEQASAAAFV